MMFFNGFLSYLVQFIVFAVLAFAGVMVGSKLRKAKDRKRA